MHTCPTKFEQDQTWSVVPGEWGDHGGLSGVGEGTMGGCPRWVRGPWGVVLGKWGDHGGLSGVGEGVTTYYVFMLSNYYHILLLPHTITSYSIFSNLLVKYALHHSSSLQFTQPVPLPILKAPPHPCSPSPSLQKSVLSTTAPHPPYSSHSHCSSPSLQIINTLHQLLTLPRNNQYSPPQHTVSSSPSLQIINTSYHNTLSTNLGEAWHIPSAPIINTPCHSILAFSHNWLISPFCAKLFN